MTWLVRFGLALCLLPSVGIGIAVYGSGKWAAMGRGQTNALEAAGVDSGGDPTHTARFDSHELEGLPAPVQRYFRAVLTDGQPIIAAATINVDGTFNLSPTGQQWKPFTAHQRVITRRPGFLWDAKIAMFPGLQVRVVDSYIAGKGSLHAAILGLFTMADLSGGGEIARGEFMRFFAEAAWYPTALLPSQGVRWEAVDDHSANATIVDGPLTLTLLFRFNDAGLIGSFRAESRGAGSGKEMLKLPWEGSWSNYQTRDGMVVPFAGEVAWIRPEGRQQYFVGNVTSLNYEFAP